MTGSRYLRPREEPRPGRARPRARDAERAARTPPAELAGRRGGYLHWSRDPDVAILAVLPLWMAYEALRLTLAPHERNGAEYLVTESLRAFGPGALHVLRVVLGLAVLWAAISVLRRAVPWMIVTLVSALEGVAYGVVLGPVTSALTLFVVGGGPPLAAGSLTVDLIGSLGAGIFEEALFRLVLLSVLALGLTRTCAAFGAPRLVGVVAAVLLSAVAFAAFHHAGPGGEPYVPQVFAFRCVAGVVLGALFVLRGFGVVVYTHAAYDVHYYLTHD